MRRSASSGSSSVPGPALAESQSTAFPISVSRCSGVSFAATGKTASSGSRVL
jgi:hypothetical protein